MSRCAALVMGNPRSGSTLFGAMLGSHPDAAMLGELDRYPGAERQAGRICLLCDGPCPVWDDGVGRAFAARHYGRLSRVWCALPGTRGLYGELFAATGARVLVDTSKTVAWMGRRRADAADWRAARPRFVLITRDGRGTLASWSRKMPDVPVADLVARWSGTMRDLTAAYEAFDRTRRVHVRYEDLVADPAAALGPVCGLLGLTVRPGMVEYWRHDHHVFAGNFGTLSLVARWRRENGLPVAEGLAVGRDQSIYRERGLAVFDDQRWREELTPGMLAAFEAGAGDLNRAMGYG